MRISDWSSDVCSSDLRSAVLIEQKTPPETPPLTRRPRIEQQRIRPAPDSTNIINRAVTGAEARPGLLPFGTIFEDASRSTIPDDGQHQQRRGSNGACPNAQKLSRPGPVEQHAQRCY